MTLLGKALVFFNLAFALLLAGWAFNMYANGIDWTDKKEGNTPVGEFAVHEAKLDEMWKSVPLAQASWLAQRKVLDSAEKSLGADRVWYDNEMRHVFVGPTLKANPANPVGDVSIAAKDDPKNGIKKGQILLDDKGYPLLVPLKDRAGNPLESLAEYNDKDDKILQSLKEVMDKHEKQIAEANRLTDLIIGDKTKGVRGLHQRIEDEKTKNAGVLAEQDLIKPQLINTVVESELILKRKSQLERRVDELKKAKVAQK